MDIQLKKVPLFMDAKTKKPKYCYKSSLVDYFLLCYLM